MKRERSPSLPLDLSGRPVTSGTHLVSPFPLECQKTNPKYSEARRQLATMTRKMLMARGLRPTKIFTRDDGIAIDWTSAVPVWSDTYLPVESSSTATTSAAYQSKQSHENEAESDVIPRILEFGDGATDEQQLEDLVADFFVRYARTFDTERQNIADAYHLDAKFSYSVHELFQRNSVAAAFMNVKKVERFAAFRNSRNLAKRHNGRIYTGRGEISEAMSSLGSYKFCESSPTDIHWQALRLDPPFVQLLCHGTLSDGAQSISFEQSFLLVKSDEYRDSPDPWPLLIVSHLLTVRDTSLMLKTV